ncbi:tagaturonate reductase [Terrimonas pollutisoli]|uniref:tagaturonate reductase n=1 Tax=Terrimonas pollutisoli TaxID=3034147 RepID=UPI0023EADED1|nr:tagaturonate reductase [Terrimonas sp. H1YJ31]
MQLSKKNLKAIDPKNAVVIPDESLFALPEKVLQFGTGVLLRGLPDYFIDKANRQNIFNGRVVVIKSTASGGADAFDQQDGLYTLCVRGIEDGNTIEENIIHSAISRVLSAATQWEEILKCAANPDMQVIISNTTEVGIVLDADDDLQASPPRSFPAKLLAFLYKRYRVFNGDPSKGMVIIPTELIIDNGAKLEAIIEELAHQNNLEYAFMDWLENANYFCNSLVDRIVPGKLPAAMQSKMDTETGYTDDLMIMSEVYRLWAIESDKKEVKDILSFSKADKGVIITGDIEFFRELKLRLLNGSHTFSCGLAHLAGFQTVKQAMDDENFSAYISHLMMQEIAPSITSANLSIEAAKDFAAKVLDRFRNPHIDHQWLSITMQYSSKMKLRNIPVIKKYLDRFGAVPEYMATGMAGHLFFMKAELADDGKYYGELNGKRYHINDDNAAWFAKKWQTATSAHQLVVDILSDEAFWETNLGSHADFTAAVSGKLQELIDNGAVAVLQQISQPAKAIN